MDRPDVRTGVPEVAAGAVAVWVDALVDVRLLAALVDAGAGKRGVPVEELRPQAVAVY
mgnify:CR=1 FL=1